MSEPKTLGELLGLPRDYRIPTGSGDFSSCTAETRTSPVQVAVTPPVNAASGDVLLGLVVGTARRSPVMRFSAPPGWVQMSTQSWYHRVEDPRDEPEEYVWCAVDPGRAIGIVLRLPDWAS